MLAEVYSLLWLIEDLKEIRSHSYEYETNGTIDFIGLPDGTIFVSCYDENNVLHEDVVIRNKTIRGNLDYVESFYGKKIPIRLSAEDDYAISLRDYYRSCRSWFIPIALPLVYFVVIMFLYLRSKKKNTAKSDI